MMRNVFVTSFFGLFLAGALVSCGGEENANIVDNASPNTAPNISANTSQKTVFGTVQKGPAVVGGLVVAYELNLTMERTGRQLKTHTVSKR